MRGTPAQIAEMFMRRARAIPRELLKAEKANVQDGLRIAQAVSQGPYSLRLLARMGHPYAVREPNPPLPSGFINKQSGDFLAAWEIRPPVMSNGTITAAVVNASPEAKYLKWGTSKMIARPTVQLVQEQLRPLRRRRLAQALRKALATQ